MAMKPTVMRDMSTIPMELPMKLLRVDQPKAKMMIVVQRRKVNLGLEYWFSFGIDT